MPQLSPVTRIFLLLGILSHTTGSGVETQQVVNIVWSLSAAICVQRGAFERNKKTQPALNEMAAYKSQGKQLCSHILKTNCKNLDCKKFQCQNIQKGTSIDVQKNPVSGLNIIIRMKSQQKCEPLTIPCKNDNSSCYLPSNKRAVRVTSIVDSLKAHATKTQVAVLNNLKSSRFKSALSIEPLWITNEIVVKGASLSEVQEMLKGHSDVKEVRAERLFKLPRVSPNPSSKAEKSDGVDVWGMDVVEASRVWSQGITGKGVLVAHIDTGVDAEHEALKNNFRGEYGWFDPFHGKPDPYDDHVHGTHTMGTAVGQTKGIGAAPGATWMTCKGCRKDGNCTESATKTCAQWLLCPTKADGTDPDCSKAPHIISNSWGVLPFENASDAAFQAEFEEIIQCWRSAGIIPVFAAGNDGWRCKTIIYPGLSDKVITVGNVRKAIWDNGTAEYSAYDDTGRGPPSLRFKQVIKPDVSAPGTGIYSASANSANDPLNYHSMSGTSMATPHVAGTIALMLEKYPSLEYDQILAALAQSCSPVYIDWNKEQCGNISEKVYPNNHMGYGMINAYKAVFGGEEGCE